MRRRRSVLVGLAVALYVCSLLVSFGQAGAVSRGITAFASDLTPSSSAYQYQYDFVITINGSGAIAAPNGNLTFGISFKNDSGVMSGSCSLNEPKSKTKIKCVDINNVICCTDTPGGTQAFVQGVASVNGVSTQFTITVRDTGSPGVGNDYFAIDTASGFHRQGLLTDGNISIHVQT